MELQAVIGSLKYIRQHVEEDVEVVVFTDSEYVVNLLTRKPTLKSKNYQTRKGRPVRHAHDIDSFFRLEEQMRVSLQKISSHEKKGVSKYTDNNRFVDKLSRKILRSQKR